MNPNWYLHVIKNNYLNFEGRARRAEYWNFVLFNFLASVVLNVVDSALGMMLLGGLYSLAVLLPSIAVTARRLHDTNRSGWMMLIALIPVVGIIVLIVFLAQEGHPNSNQYGDDPKLFSTLDY